MAEQAEEAFIRTFLSTLSSQTVIYADDYQQPPSNSLKKVPVLPIAVPPPPKRAAPQATDTSSASASTISVTFKSLKPPASYTLSIHTTDSIAAIKAQLAAQLTAPPADAQRLLLKGKALADTKLLQEYNVKDKDTINIAIKPSVTWDPTKSPISPSQTMPDINVSSMSIAAPAPQHPQTPKRGHQRIPSVVLSPSPSGESQGTEKDILLTLDNPSSSVAVEPLSTYGQTVAKPEFWQHLHDFLQSEFTTSTDARTAWENFFCVSKGSLTVNQIAKIRDQVGIVGMAGT
ncbi:hypothetical protein J132_08724 [Termitomyces sp. J132]|nr:hypothetical protein H2248_002614 [Termitomyces sp. 'cryptogamus']KNZ79722.1 hypothetical protein J132_08724 [Termitomyces sp. J132]